MGLILSKQTLESAADALDQSLKCPDPADNPTVKEGKQPGLGTWEELFVIRETDYGKPKNPRPGVNAEVAKIVLEVLGPEDGGCATNAKRLHYHMAYLDLDSLKNPADRMYGLNNRRVAVLNGLFKAVGLDAEGMDIEDILKPDANGDMQLKGQRVKGIVRKYTYSKSGEDVKACEVDMFRPAE